MKILIEQNGKHKVMQGVPESFTLEQLQNIVRLQGKILWLDGERRRVAMLGWGQPSSVERTMYKIVDE